MGKPFTRIAVASAVMLLFVPSQLAFQQPPPTPLARLHANIERITRSVNAKWGIYIKCMETGEEIAINADETMDTMSVIKIPLMAEVFRQKPASSRLRTALLSKNRRSARELGSYARSTLGRA